MQAAFYGNAIENYMATIRLSPAIIVRGRMVRKALGCSMEVEQAWPLSIHDSQATASQGTTHDLRAISKSDGSICS